MSILIFLTSLLSAAILLLFGVHMLRKGVEPLWGPSIRDWMNARRRPAGLAMIGATSALIFQGGTAVVLIVAGMASTSTLPVLTAATIAIGAELGSALVLTILNFPITGLSPLLILVGGATYLWSSQARRRSAGRIGLGLGLVFLALIQIRTVSAPLENLSAFAPAIDYLNADPVAAALLGVMLTVLMHSSVAALLTAIAFAASGIFGLPFCVGFMIGANIGSALLPLWLLRSNAPGRDAGMTVAKAVATLRIGFFMLLLVGVFLFPATLTALPGSAPHHVIIFGHIGANAAMLLLIPALPWVIRRFGKDEDRPASSTANFDAAIQPLQLKRQVFAMLNHLGDMMMAVLANPADAERAAKIETALNRSLDQIRADFAELNVQSAIGDHNHDIQMDYAIRLERAGDVLFQRILPAQLMQSCFSSEGRQEIERLIDHVKGTILLAHEVLATQDLESAHMLVRRKQAGSEAEKESRKRHLLRLRQANQASLASSDAHLEMISSLKEINSKLSTIAYAIMDAEGGLKRTRLKSLSKTKGGPS